MHPSREAVSGVNLGLVSGIRIFAVAAVAAIGLSVAACGHGVRPQVSGHGPTPHHCHYSYDRRSSCDEPPRRPVTEVSRSFCASAPLSGHVLYDGSAGQLVPSVLTVAIGDLPPDSGVYVDWSNDHIRGYIIASFSTDSTGDADSILDEHGPAR